MEKFRYTLDSGISYVTTIQNIPYTINSSLEHTVIVQPIGPVQTVEGMDEGRIPEIATMTGARTAIVPSAYIESQVTDAFDPNNHSVGDPLIPTCSIYTHKAIRSGNWSDPTMWDVGSTPHSAPDGTATVCSGEFDILYDVFSDVKIKDIHINGRGSFKIRRDIRTRLWVDTVLVDGIFIAGEPGAPIIDSGVVIGGERQPQAEFVFWQSEAPLKTSRLGLVTSGPTRIQGATKQTRYYATGSLLAGAVNITLSETPVGLQIGDKILIPATEWGGTQANDPQYLGPLQYYRDGDFYNPGVIKTKGSTMLSQDEVRTVSAINGTVVTISSPLTFNHNFYTRVLPRGQVVELFPVVAVLTHSIRFRTAGSADAAIWPGANLSVRQKRAHMMFMLHDDIEIRYAESLNMGRTDTDPSLASPNPATIRYATSDTSQPITDPNNVRGRYPWHIHRTGAFFGRKQVVVKSVSAWAPPTEFPIPGWAITHHDSRAAVEDCVVYNVRGAGIVSELGNEIGQWLNNVVAWCRGDGFPYNWADRAEIWENHNGHMGAAYENQARQILQQGNSAHSSRIGWTYLQQDVNILKRIPDEHSLRFRDPLTQGGNSTVFGDYGLDNDTYGVENAQVPDFFDNHAFACHEGFFKSHQQYTDRTDKTPFIFKRFHCINCSIAYNMINYTFVYYFYESLWIGRDITSSVGSFLGSVSWENVFVNMRLERMVMGFSDQGHGIGYQSYWLDVEFGLGAWGVTTQFSNLINLDFGVDPTTKNTYGIMGPWVITGPTSARPRVWSVITSDMLPQPYPLAPFGPDQSFRDANPCPAIGQPPYVIINPSSDLSVPPTGNETLAINGVIVDSMGYRVIGDFQSSETNHQLMFPKGPRIPLWTTGTELAYRNGVFNDNGTWKSRLWFNDLDRVSGEHFVYSIDVTLSGFDAGFLAANTVDPNTTAPIVPVLPESIPETPISSNEVPVIITGPTHNNIENELLVIPLVANTGLVRWYVTGGADAADFEAVYVTNRWVLRWLNNGTKDFEIPDDTGLNNVYDVQVTCTSFAGISSTANISVTVTDQIEQVVSFSDNFNSPSNQFLDNRLGYVRINGNANRLAVHTNGQLRNEAGTGTTVYRLPDIGLFDNFQMRAKFPQGGGPNIRFANPAAFASGPRLIMNRNVGSLLQVTYVNAAGVSTTWTYANPNDQLCSLTMVNGTFTVRINGVVQTSSNNAPQVVEPFPTVNRFLLAADLTVYRADVMDDLFIGPA